MGITELLKKGIGQMSYGDHYFRFNNDQWEVERIPTGKLNKREILYRGKSQTKAMEVYLKATIGYDKVN